MNTMDINLELLIELKTPLYHDYFVASQLNKGFSFQMRALRDSQNLTQKDLAELADTKQSVISRIETNGVSNLSVKTLLKLASAFNVGLVLRFVSLEHLLDWKKPISLEELAPQKSEAILKKAEQFAAGQHRIVENLGEGLPLASKKQAYKFKFKVFSGNNQPTGEQPVSRPHRIKSSNTEKPKSLNNVAVENTDYRENANKLSRLAGSTERFAKAS